MNLFADMGVQPATLQSGLVAATASTDTTAPTTTITAPAGGLHRSSPASPITITGTATDTGGGVVGGVEVSADGGTTWHPATGRGTWTYTWTPGAPPARPRSRRGPPTTARNLERPGVGVTVTVGGTRARAASGAPARRPA